MCLQRRVPDDFREGVSVLVEDGWRDYIVARIRFLSFCMSFIPTSVQITFFFSPSMFSWIRVLTFSNYPLLVVSRPAHGHP